MNLAAAYLFPSSWWPPPVHLVKGLYEESKDQSQEGTKKAVGNHLWNEDESSLTEDARYSRQEFLRCTFQETSRSLQSFRTLIWAEQIYYSKTIKDLHTGRFWLNLSDFEDNIRAKSVLEYFFMLTVRVSPPRQLLELHTSKPNPPKVLFILPPSEWPIVFFFSACPLPQPSSIGDKGKDRNGGEMRSRWGRLDPWPCHSHSELSVVAALSTTASADFDARHA